MLFCIELSLNSVPVFVFCCIALQYFVFCSLLSDLVVRIFLLISALMVPPALPLFSVDLPCKMVLEWLLTELMLC